MLQEGARSSFLEQNRKEEKNTVLLVDDETHVLSALKRLLRQENYEILTAANAEEGFSVLAKQPVQVIISDHRMPGMIGTEFLSRAKSLYPQTVSLLLSGYTELSAVADAINRGVIYRFLSKPWNDEDLMQEIRGALRHWRELFDRAPD